jgi:hypothetical protein
MERDTEKEGRPNLEHHMSAPTQLQQYQVPNVNFAGRLGGTQTFTVNRNDASNAKLLEEVPDAAAELSLRQSFDLRPFRCLGLWKAAVLEGMGKRCLHTSFR